MKKINDHKSAAFLKEFLLQLQMHGIKYGTQYIKVFFEI